MVPRGESLFASRKVLTVCLSQGIQLIPKQIPKRPKDNAQLNLYMYLEI